jgi:hypothetical protein
MVASASSLSGLPFSALLIVLYESFVAVWSCFLVIFNAILCFLIIAPRLAKGGLIMRGCFVFCIPNLSY